MTQEHMTNDQYVALGKLFAAHSFMTRNIIGVLGHLARHEPEITAVVYPFVTPFERVKLCIRLLEWDSQHSGVSANAYQKLDSALRGVLDKMLVEFSMTELGIDISAWLENESEPWESFTLSVDPADLQRVALGLFSQTADLLASMAVYLAEREAKQDRLAVESSPGRDSDALAVASP